MNELNPYTGGGVQIVEEASILSRYKKYLHESNFNIDTAAKYIETAVRFEGSLDLIGKKITEAKKQNILDFLNNNKSGKQLSPHTWNNYLTYLCQYFKFMESELIMPDIARGVKRKKTERKFYKKSLPQNVIKEVYDYFENRVNIIEKSDNKKLSVKAAMRDVAYFGILISLGSRAGKTSLIKVGDIRTEITENGNIPSIGLGDKGQETKTFRPIPHFVLEAIERYISKTGITAKDDYLFRSFRAGNKQNNPISYSNMRNRIDAAFKTLGIKGGKLDNNLITPHSLRHSLGEMLQERYGTQYVQKFFNHKSITTTQMYAGRNDEKKIFNNPPNISEMYGM